MKLQTNKQANRALPTPAKAPDTLVTQLRAPAETVAGPHISIQCQRRRLRHFWHQNRVAILLYLSKKECVPVSSVTEFDSTQNHASKFPYVIQERIQGDPLDKQHYRLPLEEKLETATLVAQLIPKMEKMDTAKPGGMSSSKYIPTLSFQPLQLLQLYDFVELLTTLSVTAPQLR